MTYDIGLSPAQQTARAAWLRSIERAEGEQAAAREAAKRQERLNKPGVIAQLNYEGDRFVGGWLAVRGHEKVVFTSEAEARAAFAVAIPAPTIEGY